jgi:phosphatidate cytidylyltransferase
VLMRGFPDNARLATFTVLLCVFAADTVAYFGGRIFGRHKLAPALSPGKTWEGFVLGTAAAVLVAFFALYQDRHTYLTIPEALALGAVVGLAAAAGDLFESALKRDMQIKDTGRLLGGHGGMLDRIDSLLFAIPAGYYLILAFTT